MFGKRLNKTRKEKGYTAEKMSELLNVGLRNYQKYESGDSRPSIDRLVQIADILGVSTDYLLCRDEFLEKQKTQNP